MTAERTWYIAHNGARYGPLSGQTVRVLLASGFIDPDALLWHSSRTGWTPAGDCMELDTLPSQELEIQGEETPAPSWYVLDHQDRRFGPLSESTIREMIVAGLVQAPTLAWTPGFSDWIPLHRIPHFAADLEASRNESTSTSEPTVIPNRTGSEPRYEVGEPADLSLPPVQSSPEAISEDALGFKPDPPRDRKIAILMRRASVVVMGLLLSGSLWAVVESLRGDGSLTASQDEHAGSEAVMTNGLEEKWPAAFLDPPLPGNASASSGPLLDREEVIRDAAEAYGFVLGQRMMLDLVIDQHAGRLGQRAFDAGFRFDQQFEPAFQHVEELFASTGTDTWLAFQRNLQREVEAMMPADISYVDAVTFTEELERRVKGDIKSPVLETLLIFHPDYIEHPEREITDGFIKEYRSDGSGKAKGVEFAIEYPASWSTKDGRRPNVVQMLESENGRGLVKTTVVIKDLTERLPGESLTDLDRSDAEEIFSAMYEGVVVDDVGQVRIAGSPTIWGQVHGRVNQAGASFDFVSLMFFIDRERNGVLVQFMAAAKPIEGGTSAQETFNRYVRSFQLMVNSIEFYERYR